MDPGVARPRRPLNRGAIGRAHRSGQGAAPHGRPALAAQFAGRRVRERCQRVARRPRHRPLTCRCRSGVAGSGCTGCGFTGETTFGRCTWVARHTAALDIERQERRRHCPAGDKPRLVHHQPRHPERVLLPARRPGLHPRFRLHRDRRRGAVCRGKTRHVERHCLDRGRRSGLPAGQHASPRRWQRAAVSRREANHRRPTARYGAATRAA